jgi:hypothetical protein
MQDLSCVVHLHSLYSDGTGTVSEIARAAARNDLDVVLLTDHDTLEARQRGEEGWHDGVLVLVGQEVSPIGRNHYLAFDLEEEIDHHGLDAAGICAAVREAGGFGFAAHPFSRGSERFKRASGMPFEDLDCDALHGIELWSLVTDTAERLPSLRAALRFIAAPRRFVDHPPSENLRQWDRLCQVRRAVAIGGVDAHQFGKRIGPFVPLRLMSYRRSFGLLRTHVLAAEPLSGELRRDRELVYGALREGRCYLAMDSVAPAAGFSFFAEGPAGRVEMGAEATAGDWTLRAEAAFDARWRLLRDGELLEQASGPRVTAAAGEAGVYRVEAYRDAHGAERTWILSNPIYLR